MSTSPRAAPARTAVLLVVILAAATTSVLYRPESGAVATWWPAAGFSVGLLVTSRRSSWPLLLVAVAGLTAAANALGGRPVDVGLLLGIANAGEAWVAALVLTHGLDGRRPTLESPEAFFRMLLASVLGAVTIGAGAAVTMLLVGAQALDTAATVGPSHLAATLVIVPLMLMSRGSARVRDRVPELLTQSSLLVATVGLVFLPTWPATLAFVPLPLLIWAALRFGPYLAALQVAFLAVVATTSTTRGTGPFAQHAFSLLADPVQSGAHVQGYLVCAALMTLPTALASAHRIDLVHRLASERELSATTLDTTAAIIFVCDPTGRLLTCNAALTRITGFTEADVLGRKFWDCGLIPPERTDTVRAIFDAADGSSVPEFREADILTSAGERRRVVWSNNVVRDARGHVVNVVCTATDVTSERSTSGLVRHLLEAPVATSLVALDDRGLVTLVNRGAEELLGRTEADLVSRPVTELVRTLHPLVFISGSVEHPDLLTPSGCPDRAPETTDWTWVRSDGVELTVSTTISVVTNVVGKVTGYLCVGRDVTEQRRSQTLLVEALDKERQVVERLQQLDAAKNDFVSTVSHELRTPTTSIVGYTEMILDGAAGPVTAQQELMLEAIARNGTRLITVAGDLLTLAGLESGDSVTWHREPVDLAPVVGHAAEAMHPLLVGRHLEVEFDVPCEGIVVLGDAGHLDRMVMNLLSNAVKFTPDGGRIVCRLTRDGDAAVLVVSDTGIGVPAQEQEHLFSKFFRSSTAQERAIQGTGLGLSIIDSIVSAHGGRIEAHSEHLRGTTFTVTLPLARVLTRGQRQTPARVSAG